VDCSVHGSTYMFVLLVGFDLTLRVTVQFDCESAFSTFHLAVFRKCVGFGEVVTFETNINGRWCCIRKLGSSWALAERRK
jgi:hypothetical protein